MTSPDPQFRARLERITFESELRMAIHGLRGGDIKRFALFLSAEADSFALQVKCVKHELAVTPEEIEAWATAFRNRSEIIRASAT